MKIATLIIMAIAVIEGLIVFVLQRNYINTLKKENEELTKQNVREKKLSDGYKELVDDYESIISSITPAFDEIF